MCCTKPTREHEIAVWTENLIDYDALVDDARKDLEEALTEFRSRVADRNRAANHLADLIQRHAGWLE